MIHSTHLSKAAFTSTLLLCLTLCISAAPFYTATLEEPNLKAAQRSIQAGRWPSALKRLDKLAVQHLNHVAILFLQPYCHRNMGDLRKAIDLGTQAAAFPKYEAAARYNLACAQSHLNEVEKSQGNLKWP